MDKGRRKSLKERFVGVAYHILLIRSLFNGKFNVIIDENLML